MVVRQDVPVAADNDAGAEAAAPRAEVVRPDCRRADRRTDRWRTVTADVQAGATKRSRPLGPIRSAMRVKSGSEPPGAATGGAVTAGLACGEGCATRLFAGMHPSDEHEPASEPTRDEEYRRTRRIVERSWSRRCGCGGRWRQTTSDTSPSARRLGDPRLCRPNRSAAEVGTSG